jgi:hypothetical protein
MSSTKVPMMRRHPASEQLRKSGVHTAALVAASGCCCWQVTSLAWQGWMMEIPQPRRHIEVMKQASSRVWAIRELRVPQPQ